jgi:predicted nuclease of predicted toxin-antitoxin system
MTLFMLSMLDSEMRVMRKCGPYASEHEFVLVSKDEDFTHMVLPNSAASLIWVRVGNCRTFIEVR